MVTQPQHIGANITEKIIVLQKKGLLRKHFVKFGSKGLLGPRKDRNVKPKVVFIFFLG